ncbi:MAG: PrsW family intramembrane metalloprotease [Polynucleobacter sp.]|nr:PrsW family intramembrane metalloprotease [Polynucleobacter sp.]
MTNLEGFSITEVKPVGAKLADWIFILICAVLILFQSRPWEVMQIHHVILLAMISSSVFLLLWWSDRYEREPTCSILWALAWGAFPACFLSIIFESLAFTTLAGAFIEEVCKLLGLVVAYRRLNIQSWMDGLIIAGYIGLGFAIFEDILYAISSSEITAMIVDRGIFSIFSHTFFSGLGGIVIVFGFLSRRIWISVIGFIIAFTLHLLWNTVLLLEIFTESNGVFFIIYAVIPPVIVIISAIILRLNEKSELKRKGNLAIGSGQITQERLNLISSLKMRRDYARKISTKLERRQFKRSLHEDARKILSHP